MAKKIVFISFDYDNDAAYKNMLLAWDANHAFDFEFYNGSLKESINSTNAAYIKSQIKPKILAATHLLCIVGQYSAGSSWIDWEIKTAKENSRKLIGVKLASTYTSPAALTGAGAAWAMSFTFEAIKKALDAA